MRTRLRLAFALFLLCAGCSTVKPTVQARLPIEVNPALSDDEIRFARALAHYAQGLICQDSLGSDSPDTARNLAAAARNFSAAIELDPGMVRIYPALAVTYLSLKEADKAVEVLRQACARNPGKPQPLIDLAVACEKSGRMGEAIEHFRAAIKMAPHMDGLYRELALIYFQQKRNSEAVSLLKDGIKRVPQPDSIVTFCYNFGKLYESTGLEDHAITFYELAGTSRKKWPDPFIRIASIQMKSDLPAALRTVGHALASMPDDPKLLFLLGLLYNTSKQFEKAIEAFQRTEKSIETSDADTGKTKLNPVFYMNYGSAFERSGQYDKAAGIFKKCLGIYPDSHEVLNYLAYMWAERGEMLEEGLKYIGKAIELSPDNGAYIDTLGWILFKQKQYGKALEQVQKASELIKNDPTITEHLGDVHFALNDMEKALSCWKQSFFLDRNNKTVAAKLKQNGLDPEQMLKELEARLKAELNSVSPAPAGK